MTFILFLENCTEYPHVHREHLRYIPGTNAQTLSCIEKLLDPLERAACYFTDAGQDEGWMAARMALEEETITVSFFY